jgi:hypothetical protein
MKATLEFDLDNPDDRMAHMRAVKSLDMAIVLFELQTNLKKRCESIAEAQEADSDINDGVYLVFQQISELMYENGIIIDDLIQ